MTPDELTREAKAWFTRIKELREESETIRKTSDMQVIRDYCEANDLPMESDLNLRTVASGSISMRIDAAIWQFAHATGTSFRHAQKFLAEHLPSPGK